MPILVRCPGCTKKLRVKDALAGKRVKCPACGQPFAVPAGGAAAPEWITAVPPPQAVAPSNSQSKPDPDTLDRRSPKAWLWPIVGGSALALIAVSAVVIIWAGKDANPNTPDILAKQPVRPSTDPDAPPPPKSDPKTNPETKPEATPKPESKNPEPKPETPPKSQPDPEPKPGQVSASPELKQTVKSIRVILADPLPRDQLLKILRSTYEPLGIKIVVGRAEDKVTIEEDVTLIATYFSQAAGQFSPATESAYYLWVDMHSDLMYMVDQRSSNTFATLSSVNPPRYVFDPTPFIDARVETYAGIPTDDLKYVFFREGKGPETIGVYDVVKKDIATRQKIQGQYSSRIILGDGMLCSVNDKGLELFDLSGLPNFGQGRVFFANTALGQIRDVAIHGRSVAALIDGRLNVIHWPRAEQPRAAFTDDSKSGRLVVNARGQVRLYAVAKDATGIEPVDVRLGRLAADGSVKLEATVSSKSIDGDDPAWRSDQSGCLGANLLWSGNGRLQLSWHGDPKKPLHLCDVPMVPGSKVQAKGIKGLPNWQGRSLLLAGPLLASFPQDYGVRRLPNGQLLVYYGGTVLRLKHFPNGSSSPTLAGGPEPTEKEKPLPKSAGANNLLDLLPLTGKPVDRGVALERFTKTLPTDETVKWLKALAATTGRDNNTLFLQCVSSFGQKTAALFDGGKFKPEASAKMLKRLGSLQREDFRKWHDAFDQVMRQQCSDTAVALLLLSVDALYDNDAYTAANAQKYLDRLKQLKRDAIDRWCKTIPAFRNDELDAAITIALRDDCFMGERFDTAAVDKLLSK